MVIKLALKNIKNSIVEFSREYSLLIVSQLVAVISIFFAYGIFGSYSAKMQEIDIDSYNFGATVEVGKVGQLRESLPEMLEGMQDRLDYVFIGGFQDDMRVSMYFEYDNGEYKSADTTNKNAPVDEGRNISDKDLRDGSNVVCISGDIEGMIGYTVDIGDTGFQVIGRRNIGANYLEIPFTAESDDLELFVISLIFEQLPKQSDYIMFRDTIEGLFGDEVIVDEFKLKDADEIISMKSIIVISVAIGIVSALNTCLIYGYIISRRKKQMAVYGIIGAAKGIRLLINEVEIMLVSASIVVIGFIVYRFGIEKKIVEVYASSVSVYGFKSYFIMIMLYMICIFVATYIMLNLVTSRRLTDMLRRAKR